MVYVVSAALVLLLSLAHLILKIFDTQNKNRFDVFVCRIFRGMGFSEVAKSERDFWVLVIEKVALGLSDQQLLTGLAVLIAGFWTHCSISVYHFALVNDLAWFSANTFDDSGPTRWFLPIQATTQKLACGINGRIGNTTCGFYRDGTAS